jgi:hypothetical protein
MLHCHTAATAEEEEEEEDPAARDATTKLRHNTMNDD